LFDELWHGSDDEYAMMMMMLVMMMKNNFWVSYIGKAVSS
jgi:hypothetical protein